MGQKKKKPTVASMAVAIPPGGFAPERVTFRPDDVAEYPGLPLELFYPSSRARGPLPTSTPAPPPTRASVSSMLQLPSAVLGGALGAMVDQPVEAGLTRRLSAAASGAGQELARAPFQTQPTSPAQEAAARGLPEFEGVPGLLFDVLSDPANLVGGDPVSDVGKLAIAAGGLTPRSASALGRLYSRVAEDVLPRLQKSQHANRVRSVLKSFASADEVTSLGLEDFLAKKGNEPVTLEEVEQLVKGNQLQMRETVLGASKVTLNETDEKIAKVNRQLAPIRVWAETLPEDSPIGDLLMRMEEDRPSVLMHAERGWDELIDQYGEGADEALYVAASNEDVRRHLGESPRVRQAWVKNLKTGEVTPTSAFGPAADALPMVSPTVVRQMPGAKTIRDLARNFGRLLAENEDLQLARVDLEGNTERLAGPAKYERYTLPGEKRDYRETLVQMPEVKKNPQGEGARYRSPHWEEPDIVTHVRHDVRQVAGEDALFVEEIQSDWDQAARERGYASEAEASQREMTAAIDDMRQAFKDDPVFRLNSRGHLVRRADAIDGATEGNELDALAEIEWMADNRDMTPEQRAAYDRFKRIKAERMSKKYDVADQPFRGTRATELGVKRILLEAADRGLDQVAWTTGRQQAERYGKLLRDVKRVDFIDSTTGQGGILRVNGRHFEVEKKDLKNYIGKENAERLLASRATVRRMRPDELKPGHQAPRWGVYAGDRKTLLYDTGSEAEANKWAETRFSLDTSEHPLTIGSRGMDQQYDEVMVAQFNKLGKPYGVRAELVKIAGAGNSDARRAVREDVRITWSARGGGFHLTSSNDALFEWLSEAGANSEYFEEGAFTSRAQAEGAVREIIGDIDSFYPATSEGEEVWRLRIPEKMREDLLTRGLPLLSMAPYAATGDEEAGEAGAAAAAFGVVPGRISRRLASVQRHLDDAARSARADLTRAAKKSRDPGDAVTDPRLREMRERAAEEAATKRRQDK